jgi:hypothetical protein
MPSLGDLARLNHNNNLVQGEDADLLAMMQKYDPNAKYIATDDNSGYSHRLDFDPSKLPQNEVNKERGVFGVVPEYDNAQYQNRNAFKDDGNYGRITDARNLVPDAGSAMGLERLGPYLAMAISMGAPLGAGALAGMGIGGGAGLTAGVTGSGLTGGASNWLTQLASKAPNLARSASNGDWSSILSTALNAGASGMGLPSGSGTAANTLLSLARRK